MPQHKVIEMDLKSVETKNSHFANIKSRVCTLLGHRWMYKDYSNFMKNNGEEYHFAASRSCTRCKQHAYFVGKWENQEKSKYDYESDSHAVPEIVIDQINYN